MYFKLQSGNPGRQVYFEHVCFGIQTFTNNPFSMNFNINSNSFTLLFNTILAIL